MERFYKRKAQDIDTANNNRNSCLDDLNWEEEIKYDPGLRKQIDAYHPNHREKVRRKYLENGPCQPRTCNFPVSDIGDKPRRFIPEWLDEFGSWLEYSESKDRAYCFCCFLFREKKDAGYESFVVNGWNGYHRKARLKSHVGDVGGLHFNAMKKCDDLLQRKQHIDVAYNQISETAKKAYFTRLNGSIDTARLLLKQGLPFRGHDESLESNNRGNFKEFYDCLAQHDPELRKAVSTNAAANSCLLAPEIQRDIVECFANEVDCFNDVIDWLVQELDSRFSETSSQLLVCSAAFDPRDQFHAFDVETLMSLAKLYPDDFSSDELRELSHDLCLYIADVREDARFSNINTISELSQKMVEMRKHHRYPLVYRLLKLVLVLPVATATVERCFSGMKIVKTSLSNRMGDQHLSHRLICYLEKEEMKKVSNEAVVRRFMTMEGKGRKYDL